MDADFSHDPAVLPSLIGPILADEADLVIGSRYVTGGGVRDWGIVRRVISRGGSLFAKIVLGLKPHDLTGGFKAWRSTTLAGIPFDGVHAGGYVFQIEMTYRASRLGARVARGSDRLPGPPGGSVEDVAPDHHRGADRRPDAALGRAARPRAATPGSGLGAIAATGVTGRCARSVVAQTATRPDVVAPLGSGDGLGAGVLAGGGAPFVIVTFVPSGMTLMNV